MGRFFLKIMTKSNVVMMFFVVSSVLVEGQIFKNYYNSEIEETVISFEYVNNFIVVKLVLNDILPLKFILDTGAQHTLITKREIAEILNLKYKREFRVMGADMKKELIANLVTEMKIELGALKKNNLAMLVLDEDYYLFEEMTGMQIHGILGASFFRQYVLEIDYLKKKIRLTKSGKFKEPGKKFEKHQIQVSSGKPYIKLLTTLEQGSKPIELKYLIDSGAGVSLLLNPSTKDSIAVPENLVPGNVGTGLGGSIDGFFGRTSELQIGSMVFRDIPTHYHDIEKDSVLFTDQRNGLIGNKILNRFHVIINFSTEKLYLRPNKDFNKKFKFDKSGITLLASGINFNQYVIQNVMQGSPSDIAGIKQGDKFLSINRIPYLFLSLDGILNRLKGKEGKKIRLRIKRNGEKRTITFYLKKLI